MYKYQTKDGEIIEVKQDRREWAMEEGMLQGLGAYNEIMGND